MGRVVAAWCGFTAARDISALIGLLGSGDEPTDVARHKHVMVAQALGEDFENRQRR